MTEPLPGPLSPAPAKSGRVKALNDSHPSVAPVRPAGPTSAQRRSLRGRLQYLLELVGKSVRAAHGGVGLLSAEGELVEHVTFGVPEGASAELLRSSWGAELLQFVQRRPGPTLADDLATEEPKLGFPPGLPAVGPFVGVPINCPGRSRGGFYLARAVGEPGFGPQDLEAVVPAAAWLEQADLFEEARLLARLRLLNQVAQAAAGNLELARILVVSLRELDRHLPLHVSVVWLLEDDKVTRWQGDQGAEARPSSAEPPGHLLLAEAPGASGERARSLGLAPGMRLPVEQTPFRTCLAEGQALYADDLGAAGAWGQAGALVRGLAERGASSFCAVPLRAGDRTVGVLQSVCTRPTGFTSEQIQMLYLVADLIGPAISNCQLFGHLSTAYEELRRTQTQLVQAEKMRALGELAGGMAHEFNNSLCGALGFLELALLSPELALSVRGYLDSARVCALDAAQTVRRVQDFARWRRPDPSAQVIDLNDLVRQGVDLIRHKWENLARVRGTPIAVELHCEASARVSGSVTELREVLTNLVFNAVDAMPEGGTLALRTWSTPGDVFLSVQDTGVGIPEAVRQRLFEPFFTTKGDRGTGLGLSVVFGIVRRHGGEITVESQVRRGSTFTVRLPPVLGSHAPALVEHRLRPPAAASRSLRVLVVEDEESIRRFLQAGLTQLGHRPRLTASAEEGLTAFAEEAFDLVLTDLGLPGASGEDVARAIAQKAPQTPVVLLTGWATQLQAEMEPLEGVTRTLSKPVTLETLAATLTAVVK